MAKSILKTQMDLIPKHLLMPSLMIILCVSAGLPGCASSPSQRQQISVPVAPAPSLEKPQPTTHPGLAIARDMIGAPYRYGGTDPRGFDCSGLVYFAYRKAGIYVPRTTTEQYRQSKRVRMDQLQPGDLLFFTVSRDKLAHVAIYAGDRNFIHAPSGGKIVGYASLDDDYWRGRLIGTGRL